jgi:glutamyl-tRNA synthetase
MDLGIAYVSQENVEKEGDRPEVIRFRNPNKRVMFNDLIRGVIEFDTTELGDFIIAKDLDTPLYHFASVVDDIDLSVTHIIRGEDHISNTPRQILITEALGGKVPTFAHLPMILAPDKSKLSKRKHASIASLSELIKKGYLPEAIINFVALLGWSPQASIKSTGSSGASKDGSNEEILSLSQLEEKFSLNNVQKSGAVFNEEKLRWINREYIKKLSDQELFEKVKNKLPKEITQSPYYSDARLEKILHLITERIHTFSEVETMAKEGEIGYFFEAPKYDKALLKSTEFLPETIKLLEAVPKDKFDKETIKSALWDYATEKGRGQVLWPMRVALSGSEKSPDPFTIASILGKEETLLRLTNALS